MVGAGWKGPQSALEPAGRDAEWIAELFWWMVAGAAVAWLLVMGVTGYAILTRKHEHPLRRTRLFIIGGGAAFPTVALTVLLLYGLSRMPNLLDRGSTSNLKVRVSGERWWWRVRYELPDGRKFELANELRLPVGQRIPLTLESPDVIHSFWVPSLAGKVDLIPGRTNHMALEPTRVGRYSGACAEYCGTSHAKMKLYVLVLHVKDFETWVEAQVEPARAPVAPTAKRGADLFSALGCGACHTVRGTDADGAIGPELTHVGSRVSLGAGILGNEIEAFRRWIAHTRDLKPGVNMPEFDMLTAAELDALATYLNELK